MMIFTTRNRVDRGFFTSGCLLSILLLLSFLEVGFTQLYGGFGLGASGGLGFSNGLGFGGGVGFGSSGKFGGIAKIKPSVDSSNVQSSSVESQENEVGFDFENIPTLDANSENDDSDRESVEASNDGDIVDGLVYDLIGNNMNTLKNREPTSCHELISSLISGFKKHLASLRSSAKDVRLAGNTNSNTNLNKRLSSLQVNSKDEVGSNLNGGGLKSASAGYAKDSYGYGFKGRSKSNSRGRADVEDSLDSSAGLGFGLDFTKNSESTRDVGGQLQLGSQLNSNSHTGLGYEANSISSGDEIDQDYIGVMDESADEGNTNQNVNINTKGVNSLSGDYAKGFGFGFKDRSKLNSRNEIGFKSKTESSLQEEITNANGNVNGIQSSSEDYISDNTNTNTNVNMKGNRVPLSGYYTKGNKLKLGVGGNSDFNADMAVENSGSVSTMNVDVGGWNSESANAGADINSAGSFGAGLRGSGKYGNQQSLLSFLGGSNFNPGVKAESNYGSGFDASSIDKSDVGKGLGLNYGATKDSTSEWNNADFSSTGLNLGASMGSTADAGLGVNFVGNSDIGKDADLNLEANMVSNPDQDIGFNVEVNSDLSSEHGVSLDYGNAYTNSENKVGFNGAGKTYSNTDAGISEVGLNQEGSMDSISDYNFSWGYGSNSDLDADGEFGINVGSTSDSNLGGSFGSNLGYGADSSSGINVGLGYGSGSSSSSSSDFGAKGVLEGPTASNSNGGMLWWNSDDQSHESSDNNYLEHSEDGASSSASTYSEGSHSGSYEINDSSSDSSYSGSGVGLGVEGSLGPVYGYKKITLSPNDLGESFGVGIKGIGKFDVTGSLSKGYSFGFIPGRRSLSTPFDDESYV